MKKLSKKRVIIPFIFIKLALIFVVILFENSRNERSVKAFKQKDTLICGLGAHLNEHILELFQIASALDIRFFIVQPQTIYKYLREEDIELIE